MISKNKIKLIHSLKQKKYREKEGLFIAEGPKVVADMMDRMEPKIVVATQSWLKDNDLTKCEKCETIIATEQELRNISLLQHPQDVLALFGIDDYSKDFSISPKFISGKELLIGLDGIQDPGNLGTIIRIADWFGIRTVLCSYDTVDVFNPKVVQATMGSLARVDVVYCDLVALTKNMPKEIPLFATSLKGENIYECSLPASGLIIMGNEGNGVSKEVCNNADQLLFIPSFQTSQSSPDSLNVAVATAIVCSEFRRKTI